MSDKEKSPLTIVNNHPSPPKNEDVHAAIKAAENEALHKVKFLTQSHGMAVTKYEDGGMLFLHPQYGHMVVPHITWRQDLKLLERWLEEGRNRHPGHAPRPFLQRRWVRWVGVGLAIAFGLLLTAKAWGLI